MFSIKNLQFSRVLIIAVSISLFVSFLMEHHFKLSPCKLCLYQTYGWLSLLTLSFLFLVKRNNYYLLKLFLTLSVLVLIFILGFYHSLVELGYVNNIISCSQNNGIKAETIQDLDNLIRTTDNNDCAFVSFRILGLTLTNLSLLLSLILIILNLITIKKRLH